MMQQMKQKLLGILFAAAFLLFQPAVLLAAGEETTDARLEGYQGGVVLPAGSTTMTWLIWAVLAAICIGVMFKNARRARAD
jgi:succinate dehydrogenase/fumarate reductase cytochrome b subunit